MNHASKPNAPSCERNRDPILERLRPLCADIRQLLELGSGTGQHGVYFAAAMPWLSWQCSDLASCLPGIEAWHAEAGLGNLPPPLALDVNAESWPIAVSDAVFTANTLHIISQASVENLFRGVGRILPAGGLLIVYGPFNYAGRYTSESNVQFDQWLKQRDPASGIRDFELVSGLASEQHLSFLYDYEMPANNRLLVWKKEQ